VFSNIFKSVTGGRLAVDRSDVRNLTGRQPLVLGQMAAPVGRLVSYRPTDDLHVLV
jgi:hypothetical protein